MPQFLTNIDTNFGLTNLLAIAIQARREHVHVVNVARVTVINFRFRSKTKSSPMPNMMAKICQPKQKILTKLTLTNRTLLQKAMINNLSETYNQ